MYFAISVDILISILLKTLVTLPFPCELDDKSEYTRKCTFVIQMSIRQIKHNRFIKIFIKRQTTDLVPSLSLSLFSSYFQNALDLTRDSHTRRVKLKLKRNGEVTLHRKDCKCYDNGIV